MHQIGLFVNKEIHLWQLFLEFQTLRFVSWRDAALKLVLMNVKSVFGKNLKLYRKAKKLSQEQLSEKVDISVKHLSAIERGLTFISADLLEKLALSVEVPVSRFFLTYQEMFDNDDRTRHGDAILETMDKIIERHLMQAMREIRSEIRQKGNV